LTAQGDVSGTPVGASFSLVADSLAELLAGARERVIAHGTRHLTQRGTTISLNGVSLTWREPERDASTPGSWGEDGIRWYLDTFVAKRVENDPAQPTHTGHLVFPYTYAARSRFWDGGWGYLLALVEALRADGLTVREGARSREAFDGFLARAGERLHLQTVLSLCALYPPKMLARWIERRDEAAEMAAHWRRDLVASAIADIARTSESRRAVVSSFCYPHLEEQLEPRMGIPPYQLFQYLPGEAGDPVNSIHIHRSLDVDGGAPLDFYHDLLWLREASAAVGRPVGTITVIANNLHAYLADGEPDSPGSAESIEEWLCRVTDGYRTGAGVAHTLLALPAYRANADRIWRRWQEEDR